MKFDDWDAYFSSLIGDDLLQVPVSHRFGVEDVHHFYTSAVGRKGAVVS